MHVWERMKILVINWRDIKHPQSGGSEIYFHEMAKRWAKAGHSVSWIAGGWKGCIKNEFIDGIKIIRTGGAFSVYLLAPFAYWALKEKPDIIIDVENGIPFFTPLFSGKRKLLHIHHLHTKVWFKELPLPMALVGWTLEKLISTIYRQVNIMTISKSSKKDIEYEIMNVKKIVNPAIDKPKYRKFSKDKFPAVLFLNRIKKYKGIKTFIDSACCMPHYNFWVAGDGDYLKEMRQYAYGFRNIRFFGKISNSKKAELMQRAWIFVNPSFKEGWGIVNIEANYFGTPVIGSNVGGIRDSVINGKTGLLFEYGNSKDLAEKIEILIKNDELRKKMGENSKRWASEFSWDKSASQYLEALNEEVRA